MPPSPSLPILWTLYFLAPCWSAVAASDESSLPEPPHSGEALVAFLGLDTSDAYAADRWGPLLLTRLGEQDTRVAELLAERLPDEPPPWFSDESHSVRLACAERLHFRGRYADVLVWTEGVAPDAVYSPSLLAYLRMVAARQVVDYEAARQALAELESQPDDGLSPSRLAVVDQLRRELGREAPEGIDLVTRLMQDAGRRLGIPRVGEPTQLQQQRAIDDLDKLIKQLEEQQQQMQQAAAAAAGGSASGTPAEESRPSELKAPGEVDRKRLVMGDDWGDLPPAERERLAQELTQKYPARYRDLIGDYFQALADPQAGDSSGDPVTEPRP